MARPAFREPRLARGLCAQTPLQLLAVDGLRRQITVVTDEGRRVARRSRWSLRCARGARGSPSAPCRSRRVRRVGPLNLAPRKALAWLRLGCSPPRRAACRSATWRARRAACGGPGTPQRHLAGRRGVGRRGGGAFTTLRIPAAGPRLTEGAQDEDVQVRIVLVDQTRRDARRLDHPTSHHVEGVPGISARATARLTLRSARAPSPEPSPLPPACAGISTLPRRPRSCPASTLSSSTRRNCRCPLGARRQGTRPASAQRRSVWWLMPRSSAAAATLNQRRPVDVPA